MSKIRRGTRAVTLLLISTGISLLLAELAVRKVASQEARLESPGMFIADSVLGYRLTPRYSGYRGNRVEYMTTVKTDDIGMRSAGGETPRRGRRILVLGDSFIFGQGVSADEALPRRLEHHLLESGLSIHVLNAGTPGYGTRQQAAWLERFGAELRPDLVVLSVFLGNDLRDNVVPGIARLLQGTVAAPPRSWHSPATTWLYRHSHLYALARGGLFSFIDLFKDEDYAKPSAFDAFLKQEPSVEQVEADSTRAGLDRLLKAADRLDAPVIALLIPDAFQIEQRRIDWLAKNSRYKGSVDLNSPNRVFAKLLCDFRISFVDLTPVFRAAESQNPEPLYFARDRHWNARGHELAARTLASVVLSTAVTGARGDSANGTSLPAFEVSRAQGVTSCDGGQARPVSAAPTR